MHQHSQITRRSLLKTFGAAGVGACALPYLVPSRALAGEGANRKLNLALLGCGGRMGQILGSALQQGDKVVAICDVDARQIAHLKKALRRQAGGGQGLRGLPQAAGVGEVRGRGGHRRRPAMARADEQGRHAGRQARLLREAAGP